ncbi:hypothetical protein [Prevotella sp. HUN102]|uniref:hypothetical protein n=1 Tax=Prevotella sp. HUN102 TaxID=1392486 RepID=UPI0004916BA9|nr:hypothetical protein [Prevotella sp. HUN102]
MKLKPFILFVVILLSSISCYADNDEHGFPKAWEKWRAKLEKDSGKVIAYSVKRDWVLYNKHQDGHDSQWVRNMRKKKDWEIFLYIFDPSALPTVNIDTCKTNFTIKTSVYYKHHISPDGRAMVTEVFDNRGGAGIEYLSLETGKSKELTYNIFKEEEGTIGFDSDSTFYTWEEVFCDKKGKVVESFEESPGSMAELGSFIYSGLVYKDYYRKVRYNTKGKKLSVGKLISSRKMREEDCGISNNINNILFLLSWGEPKVYNKDGGEVRDSTGRIIDWWCAKDSLLNQGVYTYYYHRQNEWADATSSKRYTRGAVQYLEKHRWGNQNEVPQEVICKDEENYYRWMPVMCDAQGRVASDDAIFPVDPESYYTETRIIDVKDVEEALRTRKIQYLYRRMWYKYYDKYLGCDNKLYTKDEVVAIEKDNFRWPDKW